MYLNINQTKLIGLTMELDLKVKEYKMLCEKLDKLKENKIDGNNEILVNLKREFSTNHQEIVKINAQIKELKSMQENKNSQEVKYNSTNIFRKRTDNINMQKDTNAEISVIKQDNILKRLLRRIKKLITNK